MSSKKKEKMKKFVEFVHDEGLESLYSSSESLKSFDEGLATLLKRADAAQAHSWISKAKDEMTIFAEQVRKSVTSKFSGLSRAQLLAELQTKMEGGLAFQQQFRNKKPEELSDEEIRSILDDRELLKTLNEKKGMPTDGSGEGKS